MKKYIVSLILAIILFSPYAAFADNHTKNPCSITTTVVNNGSDKKMVDIPACVSQIYTWSLGISAILATLMIVYGGYLVMTAAGNGEQASEGKEAISSALVGMVLLFAAYLILRTINPALVDFNLGTCIAQDGSIIKTARSQQVCEAQSGLWSNIDLPPTTGNTSTVPPRGGTTTTTCNIDEFGNENCITETR